MATQSLNLPYLLLAGAIAVAAIVVFSVLQPALADIQNVQNEIANTQANLNEREAFLRTLDAKLAELEINREHETRLQAVLPTDKRVEDALRIVHQSAQSAGVVVTGVANDSEGVQSELRARQSRGAGSSLPDSITPLGASISFRGSYQNIRAFFTALEKAPRLMDIQSIALTRDAQDVNTLAGEMLVRFYMLERSSN